MASVLTAILRIIMPPISWVLAAGRALAWMSLALMVVVILVQVVARYVFNNALPWPDEAARFLMLWMTGLAAPSAYRWGGFVAIDMLPAALPRISAHLLTLALLVMSAMVLWIAIGFGWKHTMGFGGNFNSSSLVVPLDWIGGEAVKVKLRYMYGSLLVCVFLLLVVNLELVLRTLLGLFTDDPKLPDDGNVAVVVD